MDQFILRKTEKIMKARKQLKARRAAVSVLAVCVMFGTISSLILPARAAESEVFCGYEEKHSDKCYRSERRLICELPESGHTHSEACYEERTTLCCGKEETEGHLHTEECFEEHEFLNCTNTDPDHEHGPECFEIERYLVCDQLEIEPHQHDESCYSTETVLICEIPECEGHQHSEECYQTERILICDKPLHEHTLQCYSNPEADLESPYYWESLLANVELTGEWSRDVLEIAKTQIGYTESRNNYRVNSFNEKQGYTRYGAWYGDPYGDWCAMFCAFCLYYAQVTDYDCSYTVREWVEMQEEAHAFRLASEYLPVPGDLVVFRYDENSGGDHIGFVYELISDGGENIRGIRTIEGNRNDDVNTYEFDLDDPSIYGYCVLPENPNTDNGETEILTEADENGEETAEEDLDGEESESDVSAAKETFQLMVRTAEDITVIVRGEPDALPYPADEVQLTAVNETEPEAIELMHTALEENGISPEQEILLDIRLWHEGEEIQPTGPITVTILGITETEEDTAGFAFHIDAENGTAENMNASDGENGEIVLETDHFSLYAAGRAKGSSELRKDNGGLLLTPANGNSNRSGTTVSVQKVWSDSSTNPHINDRVFVQLKNNGHPMTEYTAELNYNNNWSYSWTNLPSETGTGYTVTETNVPEGYTDSYSRSESGSSSGSGGSWVQVSTMTAGKSYVFTNGDGKACNGGGPRQYAVVSESNGSLQGTVPEYAIWTAEDYPSDPDFFYLKNNYYGPSGYMYNAGYYIQMMSKSNATPYRTWYGNLSGVVWYSDWSSFCVAGTVSGGTSVFIYEYQEDSGQEITFTVTNTKQEQPPPTQPPEPPPIHPPSGSTEPAMRKWVDQLDDNDYNLSLAVTSPDAVTGIGKLDVLMIVDCTDSMKWKIVDDGTNSGRKSYERWDRLKDAVDNVLTDFQNAGIDANYSMIAFSSDGWLDYYFNHGPYGGCFSDATTLMNWTYGSTGSSGINNYMYELRYGSEGRHLSGSTNYEAPFFLMNQSSILGSARSEAKKVVLFITDGEPNTYYGPNGESAGDSSGNIAKRRAIDQLSRIYGMDEFYAIGVGNDAGLATLEEIAGYAPATYQKAYSCLDVASLESAIRESLHWKDWSKLCRVNGSFIEDQLSENAKCVSNAALTLSVTGPNGETIQTATGTLQQGASLTLPQTDNNPSGVTLSALYDSQHQKITVSTDRPYYLEPAWTYRVTTEIEPTETAKSYYYNHQSYPHTGESGTGITSDGRSGFKSNTDGSALLKYTSEGSSKAKEFHRPVIQVKVEERIVLPETGGTGTLPYTLGGSALLLSAVPGFIRKRKEKN